MIVVNIDGVDATGKTTLVENLMKHYKKNKVGITYLHFPRYTTEIGKVIRKALDGQITMHPSALQMLYSADRLSWSDKEYKELSKKFSICLVDRYTTSGLVYGQIDGLNKEEILFNDRRIVKPDKNIILFADIKTIMHRLKDRNIQADLYEKEETMKLALEKYLELYKYYPSVNYINANQTLKEVRDEAIKIIDEELEIMNDKI